VPRQILQNFPIVIRRLRSADYEAWWPRLHRLDLAAFGPSAELDIGLWEYAFTNYRVLVALKGNVVVGALVATPPSVLRGRSWCWSLGTHPKYQGQGIGKALLRRWFSQRWPNPLRGWALQVVSENHQALGLYKKAGFIRRRFFRDYFGDGVDGFCCYKESPSAIPIAQKNYVTKRSPRRKISRKK